MLAFCIFYYYFAFNKRIVVVQPTKRPTNHDFVNLSSFYAVPPPPQTTCTIFNCCIDYWWPHFEVCVAFFITFFFDELFTCSAMTFVCKLHLCDLYRRTPHTHSGDDIAALLCYRTLCRSPLSSADQCSRVVQIAFLMLWCAIFFLQFSHFCV